MSLKRTVLTAAFAPLLFLTLGLLSGCEEDEEPEVEAPLISGSGTNSDPYVILPDQEYPSFSIGQSQQVYFAVRTVEPRAIYTVRTDSAEDVDLIIYYRDIGFTAEACKPAEPDGNEQCWVYTDGGMDAFYFAVDGIGVPSGGASFTVEVPLGFTHTEELPPSGSVNLQGAGPEGYSLSGRLQAELYNIYYLVYDGTAAVVPLNDNAGIADECDVNYTTAGPDETCLIPELIGPNPFQILVANFDVSFAETFTLDLLVP